MLLAQTFNHQCRLYSCSKRLGIEINCKEFSVKIGTDVFLCFSYIKQNFIKILIHGIRSCTVNILITTLLKYYSTHCAIIYKLHFDNGCIKCIAYIGT